MLQDTKKILIIDEYGFSRICSAILADVGYHVTITTVSDLTLSLNVGDFDLVVMSYPYCTPVFDKIGWRNTPIIILADNFDENLIGKLDMFESSYCMIKPLDYEKFKLLAKEVISGEVSLQGGYNIV